MDMQVFEHQFYAGKAKIAGILTLGSFRGYYPFEKDFFDKLIIRMVFNSKNKNKR